MIAPEFDRIITKPVISPGNRFDRRQYLALLSIVGDFKLARKIANDVCKWRDQPPLPEHFEKWEAQHVEGALPPERVEKQMRKRMMAAEEWKNRDLIDEYRKAGREAVRQAAEGTLRNAAFMKYPADAVGFLTQSTADAYGKQKQQQQTINLFQIDTGEPRRPRLRKPEVVDVTPKELPSGNGNS